MSWKLTENQIKDFLAFRIKLWIYNFDIYDIVFKKIKCSQDKTFKTIFATSNPSQGYLSLLGVSFNYFSQLSYRERGNLFLVAKHGLCPGKTVLTGQTDPLNLSSLE